MENKDKELELQVLTLKAKLYDITEGFNDQITSQNAMIQKIVDAVTEASGVETFEGVEGVISVIKTLEPSEAAVEVPVAE